MNELSVNSLDYWLKRAETAELRLLTINPIVDLAEKWFDAQKIVKEEIRDPMVDDMPESERIRIGSTWDDSYKAEENLFNEINKFRLNSAKC